MTKETENIETLREYETCPVDMADSAMDALLAIFFKRHRHPGKTGDSGEMGP